MDYSSDDCKNQFTNEQIMRIRANIGPGGRQYLSNYPTASNLNLTGCVGSNKPIAQIGNVNNTSFCVGTPIQFIDSSLWATSWEWDVDNNGIVDYTNRNPNHTYSSSGIYSVKLKISNNNWSDSIIKTNFLTLYDAPLPACTVYAKNLSNNYGIGIRNIVFNTINNTTDVAKNDGGYKDFTCTKMTTLDTGVSYPISITTGRIGTTLKEDVKVFIDYDNDGVLEITELVFFTNDSLVYHSGIITIPSSGTALNTPIRMRAISDLFTYSILGSCDSVKYGQAEDYTIIINGLGAGISNMFFSGFVNIYPNPATSLLNIDFNNLQPDEVTLTNILGQQVFSTTGIKNNHLTVEVKDFAKGIYFYRVKKEKQIIAIGKLIVSE
ncbi:MAG: hypothetical protein A3H98_14360 [Bacteroidetes bacterium RIFCSPLOWO2_02_FULL_36_8]|nr:MAG: hypothetical protein A3H98_14360 [Bacteroidetes bacterium RIFCSPLOWO2_02_FULL_36_8]